MRHDLLHRPTAPAHGALMTASRRAFIMVWDGMRPDLISPELTPRLSGLAAGGVRFVDSHAVFPTVTRVNAASLATGVLPSAHGVVGNAFYAPLVDPRRPISTGESKRLLALAETRGGRLLPHDTLADRVAAAGGRTVVVSTGSPGSSLLCHPRAREHAADRVFNRSLMMPEGADRELVERLGPIPPPTIPNREQNAYFTRAVAEYVLPELDPRLLVFWHTDPDKTQHHRAPAGPETRSAIRDADSHLGQVLGALDVIGRRADWVIAVVSDHGWVAVDPPVEATAPFVAAGLAEAVRDGRVIPAPNGGSLYAYVPDGDASLIDRAAAALQDWEHGGPVFSGARGRPPAEGTLPLAAIGMDGELAPDVLCALAWNDGAAHGHLGRSAGLDSPDAASHGGISPYEVRNTLVMAGAGLKIGLKDALPAGNLDLAPTLLHLLGLQAPPDQHGRVLAEALLDGPDSARLLVERAELRAERGTYSQSVRFSLVGGARYLDVGRAERRSL